MLYEESQLQAGIGQQSLLHVHDSKHKLTTILMIHPVATSTPLIRIIITSIPMAHSISRHLKTSWIILIHFTHFLTEGFIGFASVFPYGRIR
jgi:hypothetical protein